MSSGIVFRRAQKQDLAALQEFSTHMRTAKVADYYETQLSHQEAGRRDLLLIFVDTTLVGYGIYNRQPRYGFYAAHTIPEIQDLNIHPDYRRRGLATSLIKACEDLARAEGRAHIGISVGLHAGFGAAQILYAKMGYVPDGLGVTYDRQTVREGEFRPVDDQLCLMLVKNLGGSSV